MRDTRRYTPIINFINSTGSTCVANTEIPKKKTSNCLLHRLLSLSQICKSGKRNSITVLLTSVRRENHVVTRTAENTRWFFNNKWFTPVIETAEYLKARKKHLPNSEFQTTNMYNSFDKLAFLYDVSINECASEFTTIYHYTTHYITRQLLSWHYTPVVSCTCLRVVIWMDAVTYAHGPWFYRSLSHIGQSEMISLWISFFFAYSLFVIWFCSCDFISVILIYAYIIVMGFFTSNIYVSVLGYRFLQLKRANERGIPNWNLSFKFCTRKGRERIILPSHDMAAIISINILMRNHLHLP